MQTRLRIFATAGVTYTIQLGLYPYGAAPGAGLLDITQPSAIPGDDNCATPTVVVGTGSFPFDNTNCTASCDGQSSALCVWSGSPWIDTDEWFQWVAPSTGRAVLSTCGSGIDT